MRFETLLYGFHELASDIKPIELIQLPNTGGAGNIGFGEIVANYVNSYENKPHFT